MLPIVISTYCTVLFNYLPACYFWSQELATLCLPWNAIGCGRKLRPGRCPQFQCNIPPQFEVGERLCLLSLAFNATSIFPNITTTTTTTAADVAFSVGIVSDATATATAAAVATTDGADADAAAAAAAAATTDVTTGIPNVSTSLEGSSLLRAGNTVSSLTNVSEVEISFPLDYEKRRSTNEDLPGDGEIGGKQLISLNSTGKYSFYLQLHVAMLSKTPPHILQTLFLQ